MADRDKVIRGLEEIQKSEWMYKHADYYQMICKDALELLKAQEPRVLMLAEVKLKAPVWCETRLKNKYLYQGWGLTYDVQTGQGITGRRIGMAEPSGHVRWLPLEKYGETWRFWSSEPTDEQREAVKWDG